jgi:hypothetical protein
MAMEFQGTGLPMDQDGIEAVTELLRIGAAELWAVLTVETKGCGFLPDRRPQILYERHIFSRETKHKFDGAHPNLSNPKSGGYGASGAHQYDRLARAITLDRNAALRSTSWGLGQVMGFNANPAGFANAEQLVAAMTISENEHLLAMAKFIAHIGADKNLRARDWAGFARKYNGVNFKKNNYDVRLAAAFNRHTSHLPDLDVRAAQLYLTYLGFHPGTVDGVNGKLTKSALHEFQEQAGLPVADDITDEILALLQERAVG